jgi:hypothetical protein
MAFILFWTCASILAAILTNGSVYAFGRGLPGDIPMAIAQTLVLSVVVRWYRWWLPATVAANLTQFAAIISFRTSPQLRTGMPLITAAAAMWQWLLLRRYGWRSATWIAIQIAASRVQNIIATALYPRQLDFTHQHPVTWMLATAAIAASGAILQGAALFWIMRPEVAAASASHAAATDSAVNAPRYLRAVRACLAALVVMIGVVTTLSVGQARASEMLLMLAIAAPWLATLALLSRPRLTHVGLTLSACLSILALLPLVPYVFIWSMLGGWGVHRGADQIFFVAALATIATLLATAVLASLAARRLPSNDRQPWSWPAGFIASVTYALMVVLMFGR